LFHHSTIIPLRFVDMDSFGHINNANYLTYIEEARIKYFDDVINYKYDWSKQGIILAHAEIDFKVPGHFRNEVLIYTRCTSIGTKSISHEYEIVKRTAENSITIAAAKTVVVMFDYEKNISIPVPEQWKKAIKAFERSEL
jgi:acyl-CoA thioester hydrolase